jgi:hypothetical protein
MSIFGPTITFHTSDPTDVVVISSVTWTQFAYLRNVIHDNAREEGTSTVDVVLPDDFRDWLSFVRDGAKRRWDVDFALSVREACTSLGLIRGTRLDGRLEHMLRGAAQQFASSLTAWDLSTCDFVQLVARNTTIRARCTALFLQHGDDPRCQVDFLLRTGDDDAGETS